MSNTEFNSEDSNASVGHVATADDFFARMAEIQNMGAAPEMCVNKLVASGFPPDMCATAHPENFRNGASYPDQDNLPDNHPMQAILKNNDGIYNNNALMDSLKVALGDPAPSLNSAFSAKAGDGYEAPQEQFDIKLETAEGPTFG